MRLLASSSESKKEVVSRSELIMDESSYTRASECPFGRPDSGGEFCEKVKNLGVEFCFLIFFSIQDETTFFNSRYKVLLEKLKK